MSETIDSTIRDVTVRAWFDRGIDTHFKVGDLVLANSQSVQGVIYRIEGFQSIVKHYGSLLQAYLTPLFSLWFRPTERHRPKWALCENLEPISLQRLAIDYARLGNFIMAEARRLSGKDDHEVEGEDVQQQEGGPAALPAGDDAHLRGQAGDPAVLAR